MQQSKKTLECAICFLGRREYSRQDLAEKLKAKGYEKLSIDEAINYLIRHNLLSESRFITAFINEKIRKCYGYNRIYLELKNKGIDSSDIDMAMDEMNINWLKIAQLCWKKKFSRQSSQLSAPCTKMLADQTPRQPHHGITRSTRQKQYTYLRNKGHDHDHIVLVLSDSHKETLS